ncbi:hypothetical protein [Micavibrio aeruginosavorus]|uniref:hypothetical protein n=1 Tax=Micavibrio aeruginosavorus TaxID=349221 RepID=UPI003F4AB1D1
MTPHIKEYYRIGTEHIILVMTPERRALQAWVADDEQNKLMRKDVRIIDIQHGDGEPLTQDMFDAFCTEHKIDSSIPDRSIALSFRLSSASTTTINIVPTPSAMFARTYCPSPF